MCIPVAPAFSPNVPSKHFCAAVNPTRDMFLCTAQVGRYRCSCNPPRLLPALAAGGGPAEEEALNLPRESQSTANNPHDAQQECQPTSAHRKRKRIRGGVPSKRDARRRSNRRSLAISVGSALTTGERRFDKNVWLPKNLSLPR